MTNTIDAAIKEIGQMYNGSMAEDGLVTNVLKDNNLRVFDREFLRTMMTQIDRFVNLETSLDIYLGEGGWLAQTNNGLHQNMNFLGYVVETIDGFMKEREGHYEQRGGRETIQSIRDFASKIYAVAESFIYELPSKIDGMRNESDMAIMKSIYGLHCSAWLVTGLDVVRSTVESGKSDEPSEFEKDMGKANTLLGHVGDVLPDKFSYGAVDFCVNKMINGLSEHDLQERYFNSDDERKISEGVNITNLYAGAYLVRHINNGIGRHRIRPKINVNLADQPDVNVMQSNELQTYQNTLPKPTAPKKVSV